MSGLCNNSKTPRKLTLHLTRSFENSMQVLVRALRSGENWGSDRTCCREVGKEWRFYSFLRRADVQLSGHVVDDGGDTGATNSHPHFLQAEGMRAVLRLPSKDQDLLLDGNRVHGVVFLPLGIDAAQVSALGLCNLGGEPVGVPGDAAGGASQSEMVRPEKGRWAMDKSHRHGLSPTGEQL